MIEASPTPDIATSAMTTTLVTIALRAVMGPPRRSRLGWSSSRQFVMSAPIAKKTMPMNNTMSILYMALVSSP
jgi:hypothetical protein